MSNLIKSLFLAIAVTLIAGTQAHAKCSGKARVKLSDGSVACVLRKETTEITYSQSIVGAGPAAKRKSQHTGALLVVKFEDEKEPGTLPRKVRNKRVKELCHRYRAEFLDMIKHPANPFLVIVSGYETTRFAPSVKAIQRPIDTYFSKNCWIKR